MLSNTLRRSTQKVITSSSKRLQTIHKTTSITSKQPHHTKSPYLQSTYHYSNFSNKFNSQNDLKSTTSRSFSTKKSSTLTETSTAIQNPNPNSTYRFNPEHASEEYQKGQQIGLNMTQEQLEKINLPNSTLTFGSLRQFKGPDILLNTFSLTIFSVVSWYFAKFMLNTVYSFNHWDSFSDKINKSKNERVLFYHNDSESLLLQPLELIQDVQNDDISPAEKDKFAAQFQQNLEAYLYKEERSSYHDLVIALNEFKNSRKKLKELTKLLQLTQFIPNKPQKPSQANDSVAADTDNTADGTNPPPQPQTIDELSKSRDFTVHRLQSVLYEHLCALAAYETYSTEIAVQISTLQHSTLEIAAHQTSLSTTYPKAANYYYLTHLAKPMIEFHSDLRNLSLKLLKQQLLLKSVLGQYHQIMSNLIAKTQCVGIQSLMDVNVQLRYLDLSNDDEFQQCVDLIDKLENLPKFGKSTQEIEFNELYGLNSVENIADIATTVEKLNNVIGSIQFVLFPQLDKYLPQAHAESIDVPIFPAERTQRVEIINDHISKNASYEDAMKMGLEAQINPVNVDILIQEGRILDTNGTKVLTREHLDLAKSNTTLGQQFLFLLPPVVRNFVIKKPEFDMETAQILEIYQNVSEIEQNDQTHIDPIKRDEELVEELILPVIRAVSLPRGAYTEIQPNFDDRHRDFRILQWKTRKL
jgi:hypothetical protein